MKNLISAVLFVLSLLISFSLFASGENLDAINILASCGTECWPQNAGNRSLDNIKLEPEAFDGNVVRCMQVCFAAKTKKVDNEENLPPQQVLKIKASAFCGYICFANNKAFKKALDYCYAGCLGTVLQPRNRLPTQPQQQQYQLQQQAQLQSSQKLSSLQQQQAQHPTQRQGQTG